MMFIDELSTSADTHSDNRISLLNVRRFAISSTQLKFSPHHEGPSKRGHPPRSFKSELRGPIPANSIASKNIFLQLTSVTYFFFFLSFLFYIISFLIHIPLLLIIHL